jgi:mRNA interferase MazF
MPSTTRYKRGDIVLVPFPFTDLSSSKRRPALVISADAFNDRMEDVVVAAITSQLTSDHAVTIDQSDCVNGMLPRVSVVKLVKVLRFTRRSSSRNCARFARRSWPRFLARCATFRSHRLIPAL